ncbi:hypothetical protein TNCV_820601 [Trichonephila clavipes]|nr:hypothetical protein TNCV_820601 [Trichonephila clavipes]
MGAFGSVTITSQCYECLLCNHTIPDLQQHDCVDGIIFKQDGAPLHIANLLLKGNLGNAKFISHHFHTACLATQIT